jgi:hypothetical protein
MNQLGTIFAWQEFFWNTIQSNGPPSQHQSSPSIFLSFCASIGFIDWGTETERFYHLSPRQVTTSVFKNWGAKLHSCVYWMPYHSRYEWTRSRTWLVWSIQWELKQVPMDVFFENETIYNIVRTSGDRASVTVLYKVFGQNDIASCTLFLT